MRNARRIPVSACGLCLLLACGLAGAEEKSWEQFVAGVEQLQRAGQYSQAEAVLSATLKESARFAPGDSRMAVILYKLGNIYSHLGRPAEAERFFLRSLSALEKSAGPTIPVCSTR
jgi:tetratricopeptide (TPR) repeat protein